MLELGHFLRTRWLELLVAGIWLQSVVAAAFTGNWAVLVIAALGGLLLLLLILWIVGLRARRRRRGYGVSEAFAVPRQAIVFTVGRQKDTILMALEAQRPAWLGLVCSRDTEQISLEIEVQSGLDAEHVRRATAEPFNIVDVRQQTASLLDWIDLHQVDRTAVAVDITGGTAIMSIGAFTVSDERHVDCQYVRSEYGVDNKTISGSQRGIFIARYHGS